MVVLGSRHRGDDAVGPLVGDLLRARGIDVLDCGDEPTRLIDPLAGLRLAVVVDAVRTGAVVGTLHTVEATDGVLPHGVRLASSHAVGIAEAVGLARALGRAPERVVVIGIEGRAFGMGDALTADVERALEPAADAVCALLATVG